MKPCEGTFLKQNAEKWGQAGINIDECRINNIPRNTHVDGNHRGPHANCYGKYEQIITPPTAKGRWPANVILDEEAAKMLDEQSGVLKSGSGDKHSKTQMGGYQGGFKPLNGKCDYSADSGGASRFFYCAKASSSERNEGLEGMPEIEKPLMGEFKNNLGRETPKSSPTPRQNHHPTVKPLKLMQYLIKLVMPPKDGVLLDPFAGSRFNDCRSKTTWI